jgi:hypothetical protein
MGLTRLINYQFPCIICTNTDCEHFKLVRCSIKASHCNVGISEHCILLKLLAAWCSNSYSNRRRALWNGIVIDYVTLLNNISFRFKLKLLCKHLLKLLFVEYFVLFSNCNNTLNSPNCTHVIDFLFIKINLINTPTKFGRLLWDYHVWQRVYFIGTEICFLKVQNTVSFSFSFKVIRNIVLLLICLYSTLLGVGRFFNFLILHTVGRTPWTGGSVRRNVSTYTQTNTKGE